MSSASPTTGARRPTAQPLRLTDDVEVSMARSIALSERRTREWTWLRHLRLADATGNSQGDARGGAQDDPKLALERTLLPRYLSAARWYGAKDAGTPTVEIADLIGVSDDAAIAVLQVGPPGRDTQRYLLPLTLRAADGGRTRVIAPIRQNGSAAALIDALEDEGFAGALIARFGATEEVDGADIVFRRTSLFQEDAARLTAARPHLGNAEQSNTSIRYGDVAILKVFRRLAPGIHPELEIGHFLTETAHYRHTPPLLGWVEMRTEDGERTVLAVLQRLIRNAADGWDHVLDGLRQRLSAAPAGELATGPMIALASRLGVRTAELHRAFATPTDDPAFAPEPVGPEVLRSWGREVRTTAERALDGLNQAMPSLAPDQKEQAQRLLAKRAEVRTTMALANTTSSMSRLLAPIKLAGVAALSVETAKYRSACP